MLPVEVWQYRQESTRAYVEALANALDNTWQNVFSRAADLPTKMVLCHPRWLAAEVDRARVLNLGSFDGGERRGICASERLWGYACPLLHEPLHADHLFPRSLGGPRLGTNQVWLCRLHNSWKSADLVSFPWEEGEPTWLEQQLLTVSRVVSAGARLEWH